MTTVDQNIGKFSLDTLKVLQKYRRVHPEKKYESCFGVNVLHQDMGYSISVGDKIEVLSVHNKTEDLGTKENKELS